MFNAVEHLLQMMKKGCAFRFSMDFRTGAAELYFACSHRCREDLMENITPHIAWFRSEKFIVHFSLIVKNLYHDSSVFFRLYTFTYRQYRASFLDRRILGSTEKSAETSLSSRAP